MLAQLTEVSFAEVSFTNVSFADVSFTPVPTVEFIIVLLGNAIVSFNPRVLFVSSRVTLVVNELFVLFVKFPSGMVMLKSNVELVEFVKFVELVIFVTFGCTNSSVGDAVGVVETGESAGLLGVVGVLGLAVGVKDGTTGAGVRLLQLAMSATRMKNAARKVGTSPNQKMSSFPLFSYTRFFIFSVCIHANLLYRMSRIKRIQRHQKTNKHIAAKKINTVINTRRDIISASLHTVGPKNDTSASARRLAISSAKTAANKAASQNRYPTIVRTFLTFHTDAMSPEARLISKRNRLHKSLAQSAEELKSNRSGWLHLVDFGVDSETYVPWGNQPKTKTQSTRHNTPLFSLLGKRLGLHPRPRSYFPTVFT